MRWLGVVLALGALACGSDTGQTTGGGGSGATSTGSTSSSGGATSGTGGAGASGGAAQGGQGGVGQGGDPTGGGGQGGGGGGMACTWGGAPCPGGSFCDAPGCGAGTCKPITSLDDGNKSPVCGCDGVTYWNAATASDHGMAMASPGVCPIEVFCGGFGNIPCPKNDLFCAFDVKVQGGCAISDASGSCWGMPATCSTVGFGGDRRLCGSPNGACLYECDAIKSGQTYWGPDSTCPM
ncbi:MAG: hypothetical protein R3B72_37545 [Polyangiaceae bacterium]